MSLNWLWCVALAIITDVNSRKQEVSKARRGRERDIEVSIMIEPSVMQVSNGTATVAEGNWPETLGDMSPNTFADVTCFLHYQIRSLQKSFLPKVQSHGRTGDSRWWALTPSIRVGMTCHENFQKVLHWSESIWRMKSLWNTSDWVWRNQTFRHWSDRYIDLLPLSNPADCISVKPTIWEINLLYRIRDVDLLFIYLIFSFIWQQTWLSLFKYSCLPEY